MQTPGSTLGANGKNGATSAKYATQGSDHIISRKKSAAHNSVTNASSQAAQHVVVGRYGGGNAKGGGQRASAARKNSNNVTVTEPAPNIFLSGGSNFGSMTSSTGCVDETNMNNNTLDMLP